MKVLPALRGCKALRQLQYSFSTLVISKQPGILEFISVIVKMKQ